MEHVIVTGGLGFIGLNLISKITSERRYFVHNIDNCSLGHTYFDSYLSKNQKDLIKNYRANINEHDVFKKILNDYNINKVFHLAAESHVDRSITNPTAFFQSNVMGTLALVECCREHIAANELNEFRFLHISTDEVFGDLGPGDEPFNEETPYNPSSPYSSSKAASDFIIKSWIRTYNFPAIIINSSNNFGPCQNDEKFIPTILRTLLCGRKVPVYGSGDNIRDWFYVKNHVEVLNRLMDEWPSTYCQYCLGGGIEVSNLELVRNVWSILNERGCLNSESWEDKVTFVADRPGHDFRYAINQDRVNKVLGDLPATPFHEALQNTIDFYLQTTRSAL